MLKIVIVEQVIILVKVNPIEPEQPLGNGGNKNLGEKVQLLEDKQIKTLQILKDNENNFQIKLS